MYSPDLTGNYLIVDVPVLLNEEFLVWLNSFEGLYCYLKILLLINLSVFLKSLAASITSAYVGTIAVLIFKASGLTS